MVIKEFVSKLVFLDTTPLIYFIEGNSKYQNILQELFELNDKGSFSFITTSITLLEVLVKPFRENKILLAQQYKDILTHAAGIEIQSVTNSIAESAAYLRAKYNLKTPDSIQIAAAIENNSDYFFTNDVKLKVVKEINIITLGEIL
ncbi:MAG TPA: type II toxin-antitoxin system VapC family toxin [Hanamia sp.]|jgi:Predicted nucleic acid-binding protein, contains PIN domain|nr:type II toxin-antitoxin system VapC family toxin [Hanamia sp.]